KYAPAVTSSKIELTTISKEVAALEVEDKRQGLEDMIFSTMVSKFDQKLPTFSSKPEVNKKFIEGKLLSKDLIVVQTDKSGKFVLLDKCSFNCKAVDSVDKLFKSFELENGMAINKSLILNLLKNGDGDCRKLPTKITQLGIIV